MLDPLRSAYLADARRHDLLREAREGRLAAEVAHPSDGAGDRALLVLADALAGVSERLRTHLALRRLARLHAENAVPCGCGLAQPECAYAVRMRG